MEYVPQCDVFCGGRRQTVAMCEEVSKDREINQTRGLQGQCGLYVRIIGTPRSSQALIRMFGIVPRRFIAAMPCVGKPEMLEVRLMSDNGHIRRLR
jgi:hypothetical protein